jgi:tRNA-Thr(GGU) m(6)t(6)A37 methyltransferase TsaA
MKNKEIVFKPIGIIHTPFGNDKKKIPRQGRFGENNDGIAEVFPEYAGGLKDLESFSHLYLLFHFHKSQNYDLLQITPRNHNLRGVFAIRSPRRPNALGQTIVKILKIEQNKIFFTGADMIDGTPLIDIKPYVPEIDYYPGAVNGWLEKKD